jgi:hypothetical protein
MTCVPLESQRKSFVAGVAAKIVGFLVAGAYRPKAGARFVVSPTTGALEIAPAYRDKAAKALMRNVRRMKFTLKLRLLGLYLGKFALNLRSAKLFTERNFLRNFNQLRLIVHVIHRKSQGYYFR